MRRLREAGTDYSMTRRRHARDYRSGLSPSRISLINTAVGWGPNAIRLLNDGSPRLPFPAPAAPACLRSRGWWNHHGVWAGKELGLMTIVPLHAVVLTGRSLQHLDYLPASPCGADLG
jgi:hypothetical protein